MALVLYQILLVPITLACYLMLIYGIHCDPLNILQNGEFTSLGVHFDLYHSLDMIANGINTLIPYWICVHGGVQVLDPTVYNPPSNSNISFIMHMNFYRGPGHIISMPMYTPRTGAMYTIIMNIADNPDGGPSKKQIMLVLFDIYGKKIGPKTEPFTIDKINLSRQNISWQLVSCKLKGTGDAIILYLSSLVLGSYGLLIANVQVNLDTLVDNGSFENVNWNVVVSNVNYTTSLCAPSIAITKWNLENGCIRIYATSLGWFQASTDNSEFFLELNSNSTNASISTNVQISGNAFKYTLLFDVATNPTLPYSLVGALVVQLEGQPSGKDLNTQYFNLDSTSYSSYNIGWETKSVDFSATKNDTNVKITFRSLFMGSYGPYIDNVQMFKIV